MDIEIRRHVDDTEMYELWKMDKGEAAWLMCVVHGDVLDSTLHPDNYEETRLAAEILRRTP